MFARNVSICLKPNTRSEFKRIFDKEVIPMLRKQSGFRDEIIFAVPGGLKVVAISLWDTKEHAEAYKTAGYPAVLKPNPCDPRYSAGVAGKKIRNF